MALRPGSFSAERPLRRVIPNATSWALPKSCFWLKKLIICRVSARPASFDIVQTKICQRLGNKLLVCNSKINTSGLPTIAQGCIKSQILSPVMVTSNRFNRTLIGHVVKFIRNNASFFRPFNKLWQTKQNRR